MNPLYLQVFEGMKDKQSRIRTEKNRLTKIYRDLPEKKKAIAQGLIERAAYIRVSMQDLEEFLDENGYVEKFKQGAQDPYDRKRPQADLYVQFSTQYNKIIQQLDGMLPKVKEQPVVEEDVFDNFVDSREDV
jgi:hypothetical protein